MFVRWKRKPAPFHPLYGYKYSNYMYAELVESYRDRGKPRQRIIKYLGCIPEDKISDEEQKVSFWLTVKDNLDDLELRQPIRKKIEKNISERVSKPKL